MTSMYIKQVSERTNIDSEVLTTLLEDVKLNSQDKTWVDIICEFKSRIDEKWITAKGSHILIDGKGNVKGGAGGKFNGKNIKNIKSDLTKDQKSEAKSDDTKPKKDVAPTEPKPAAKKMSNADKHKAAETDLSDKEKASLLEYTGAMYRDINPLLRQGKKIPAKYKKDVANMEASFQKASTKSDITVFKGITDTKFISNLKVGESWKDDAYTSTTTDVDKSNIFTHGKESAIVEINVPKGSKAISVAGLSQFGNENEVVLNKGGSYKIKEIIKGTRLKKTRIIVEYSDGE